MKIYSYIIVVTKKSEYHNIIKTRTISIQNVNVNKIDCFSLIQIELNIIPFSIH